VRGHLQRAIEAHLEGGSFFEPKVAMTSANFLAQQNKTRSSRQM
jgi:hypothetical protein